eukprot:3468468-Prymnesium_polylepis.1
MGEAARAKRHSACACAVRPGCVGAENNSLGAALTVQYSRISHSRCRSHASLLSFAIRCKQASGSSSDSSACRSASAHSCRFFAASTPAITCWWSRPRSATSC